MTNDPPDDRRPQEFDGHELADLLGAALLGDDGSPPDLVMHLDGRQAPVLGAVYDPVSHTLNVFAGRRFKISWLRDDPRYASPTGRLPRVHDELRDLDLPF